MKKTEKHPNARPIDELAADVRALLVAKLPKTDYFALQLCSKWASSRSLVPTPSPVAQLVSLPVTHYVTNWGMEYD